MANKLLNKLINRLQTKKDSTITMGDGGYMDKMMQYNMGGKKLPGGSMVPIPGSDAVEFVGQSHEQGGILLDKNTEVEGGETMDQVSAAYKKGGVKKDYFFSDHLKFKGGGTFADAHRQILANGGEQNKIDYLAKMQEIAAGRNPNTIQVKEGGMKPTTELNDISKELVKASKMHKSQSVRIADLIDHVNNKRHGGYKMYDNGGTFQAYPEDYDAIESIYKDQGLVDLQYDPTVEGSQASYRADDLGEEGIAQTQKGKGQGYYGEVSDADREDFYNRNKNVLNEMGIESWEDFDPAEHTGEFQNKYNESLKKRWNEDENFRNAMTEQGYDLDKYIATQGFSGEGPRGLDAKYGEYTWSRGSVMPGATTSGEGEGEGDDMRPLIPSKKKRDLGPLLQFIPPIMAFTEKPDYMSTPDLIKPGVVVPERVAKVNLDRVDYNDQLARNTADAQAFNKFVETSGGGPANIINKMAMFAKKKSADSQIKANETRANTAIANQEASLEANRRSTNAANALKASLYNASSIERSDTANVRNKMYVNEFNAAADAATKDRRLMAVDTAVKGYMQMRNDDKMYASGERLARTISGRTGAYEADVYSQNLLDQGYELNSPEYLSEMENFNKHYRIKMPETPAYNTPPNANINLNYTYGAGQPGEENPKESKTGGYYSKMMRYGK
tara:strand:+ start:242 stop:2260 length:2019 start_codon:yes stop_codon:yes gene_type:complete